MLGAPPMTYLFLVASWGPGLTGEGSDLAAAAPQQRAQGIHSHWDLAGGDSWDVPFLPHSNTIVRCYYSLFYLHQKYWVSGSFPDL